MNNLYLAIKLIVGCTALLLSPIVIILFLVFEATLIYHAIRLMYYAINYEIKNLLEAIRRIKRR